MNSLLKIFTNLSTKSILSENTMNTVCCMSKRYLPSLYTMHLRNMERLENPAPKKKKSLLGDGKPFAKGLVLKTIIKKPRKPNSANRKCVIVKLSTGKEVIAFVPGEGHNLQEHQTVLCQVGRLKDTPGVKIRCVRGKYDLPHVKADK